MQFKAHPQVSASIKKEGCLLRGGMNVVVIGEFRKGKKREPVVLSFSDEDPQVLL